MDSQEWNLTCLGRTTARIQAQRSRKSRAIQENNPTGVIPKRKLRPYVAQSGIKLDLEELSGARLLGRMTSEEIKQQERDSF
jgi:hypothetical protein